MLIYISLYPMQNSTFVITYYLEDSTIAVVSEYYLYDFSAIVSAVGGSMGLFLGFSFYSTAKLLIDRLV